MAFKIGLEMVSIYGGTDQCGKQERPNEKQILFHLSVPDNGYRVCETTQKVLGGYEL